MLARTEGSNLIRLRASRTRFTSRSTSAVLNNGGCGSRSASVGAVRPGATRGRVMGTSYCAFRSLSIIACSRNWRSASVRSSSEIGAGPSLRGPLLVLNACGFVRFVLLPLAWGITDESRPVDSSHA